MTDDNTIGGSDRLLCEKARAKIEAAARRATPAKYGYTEPDREVVYQDITIEILSSWGPDVLPTLREIRKIARKCAKRVLRAKEAGKVVSLDAVIAAAGTADPTIAHGLKPLTSRQHAAVSAEVAQARARTPVETRVAFAAWGVYKGSKPPYENDQRLADEHAHPLDVSTAEVLAQVAALREEDVRAIVRGDLDRVQARRRKRIQVLRESEAVQDLDRIIKIEMQSDTKQR